MTATGAAAQAIIAAQATIAAPRAVIFDLDGVVRRFDASLPAAIELTHRLPAATITKTAFESSLLHAAVTGQITDRDWRAAVASAISRAHGVEGHRVVEEWSASAGEISHDVLDIVGRLRGHCLVGLLSNATDRLERDLTQLGITDEFDLVVNSSVLGCAKPDPAIFHTVVGLLAVTHLKRSALSTTQPQTSRQPRWLAGGLTNSWVRPS